MRSGILLLLLLLVLVGGWFLFGKDWYEDRGLPSEKQAARIFDREDAVTNPIPDPEYGTGKPFDCYRSEGDFTVSNNLKDVDFICTPRLKDGTKCRVGQCAGFAVDFDGRHIVDYRQFGGG